MKRILRLPTSPSAAALSAISRVFLVAAPSVLPAPARLPPWVRSETSRAFFPAALGFRPAPARLPPRAMFEFPRLNDFKKNNHTPARRQIACNSGARRAAGDGR